MALQSAILVPAGADGITGTLAATTAGSAIVVGLGNLFTINSDSDLTITFGNSTSGGKAATTPSAVAGLRIPGGSSFTFDLGASYDSFKIFNPNSDTATFSYMQLSRF